MRPPGLTSTFAAVNAAIMGPAPAVKSGEPPVAASAPDFALFLTTAEVFASSAPCFLDGVLESTPSRWPLIIKLVSSRRLGFAVDVAAFFGFDHTDMCFRAARNDDGVVNQD